MARWEPDAPGRLQQAALDLYRERGYDATSVAQIARRAGLTERTFFRHYADKREVLFAGSADLQRFLVAQVADAPAGSPIEVVAAAFAASSEGFAGRAAFARQRHAVVTANPALQERELGKLAALAEAMAGALQDRGVDGHAARLAAEAGVGVFKVAFERWTADPGSTLADHLAASFDELRRVAGERSRGGATRS